MSVTCTCPPPAALPSVSNQVCDEKYGNITRFIFGRTSDPFVDVTDETEFDTRLAAAGTNKIVLSPFLSDVEFPSSEIIKTAKDDKSSPFGQGFRVGETSPTVAAMLKNLEATIKDELKGLECYEDLGIMIVDSNGGIGAIGSTDFIPISNFFVGTRGFGGIDEVDTYSVNGDLEPCWDQGLQLNAPTWNPNTKQNS